MGDDDGRDVVPPAGQEGGAVLIEEDFAFVGIPESLDIGVQQVDLPGFRPIDRAGGSGLGHRLRVRPPPRGRRYPAARADAGGLDSPLLEPTPLPFGQATPNAEALVIGERVLQAFVSHIA